MPNPAELTVRGLKVALHLESSSDHVDVILEVIDSIEFAAQVQDWERRFEAWGIERVEAGGVVGDPPMMPAEVLLTVEASLQDDRGTDYRWHSKKAGGTGSHRDARWRWTPAPPAMAKTLTLVLEAERQLSWSRAARAVDWSAAE